MDWLNLKNKRIIVTGGASGIGHAIVKSLYECGAVVFVFDKRYSEEVYQEFSAKERIYPYTVDLTKKEEMVSVLSEIKAEHETVDVLINNAGINIPMLLVDTFGEKPEMEIMEDTMDLIYRVNQKSLVMLTQSVAKMMMEAKKGVIINISSESGLEGSEGQSVYAASKAALNSYTRSWAKELGKHNIRVVGVAPGILEVTGLRTIEYEERLAYTRGKTVDQLRAGYTNTSSIPLGRVGELQEVADFVTYLASDRASYIHGVTMNIAGGKTRG